MDGMNDTKPSVRDRHRQEVSALLHAAARQLAEEHGLDRVRIEEVAQRAGVSRRTFFNYYATKEDAVLGLVPPVLSNAARAAFDESEEDILTRTAHLFLEVVRSMAVTESTIEQRVELRRRFPALHARFHWYMAAAEDLVRPVIAGAKDSDEHVAEVVLRLASAVLRDAYRNNLDVTHESVAASIVKFKIVLKKVL